MQISKKLYNGCGFGVDQPGLRILFAFTKHWWSALCHACPLLSAQHDFAPGNLGEKFMESVFDTYHIALGTFHVDGIKVVNDGDIIEHRF